MTTIGQRFEAVSASGTFKRLLASTGLSTKKVLDIGCCNGEHLAHFGTSSVGITINAEEVAAGASRGLDIRLGNAEEELPVTETFDAVYANNLFDHLYSPHQFLHTTRNLLTPDGILVLGVPVFPFPHILMQHRKFRGALADAHINFFTRKTLAATV
jgi:SAM-dependent methyltransferase